MTKMEYYSYWHDQIIAQNQTFNPDKYWSVNGSETLFNKTALINHRKHWKDFVSVHSEGIKVAFFILIYKNENRKWLTECIESCLWQIADFPYQNHIVIVVDPPINGTPSILIDLEKTYGHLAKFVVEYNTKRLGWCGSYNKALDICQRLGIDIAMVSDSDDINHPERLNWTYHLLDQNKKMNCITFIPVNFNDGETWIDTCIPNDWHAAFYHDPDQVFVDSCILFNNKNQQPFFSYNPNIIGITKNVINNVRFRQEIVDNDQNITPADQAFIYEIMLKYPFTLIADDRLMQIYRWHKSNKTVGVPPKNWINLCSWRRAIGNEIKKQFIDQKGSDKKIDNIINHYKQQYDIEIERELFYVF
ncbi:MAG: glycosyltransferase [Candidatus Omnitrophica bacterium]|nr:glycosyltransferase [Candidatus Omnitrophota bacterium]